jgi:hypothetical protein
VQYGRRAIAGIWHMLMFVPSLITGSLILRVGVERMVASARPRSC